MQLYKNRAHLLLCNRLVSEANFIELLNGRFAHRISLVTSQSNSLQNVCRSVLYCLALQQQFHENWCLMSKTVVYAFFCYRRDGPSPRDRFLHGRCNQRGYREGRQTG